MPPLTRELRREDRYPLRLNARLCMGDECMQLISEDVSFHGIFLRTDSPPKLRRLVRVEVVMPSGVEFVAHGLAVHVVGPGGTRVPGVGVQFYAVERPMSDMWSEFVRGVARRQKEQQTMPGVVVKPPPPPPIPEPIRREHPRHLVELQVRFRTIEDMYVACTRDVSRGGIFIATPQDLPVGTDVIVTLVRPGTTATFTCDGRVCRRAEGGVGVEFVKLTPQLKHGLSRFINEAIPTLDAMPVFELAAP